MIQIQRVIEGQLRECYGRVVYSHKTHEKSADILLDRHRLIKLAQIFLSTLLTTGLVTAVFNFSCMEDFRQVGALLGVILSTTLLVLNMYTKDYDLKAIAQQHRQIGTDLWMIREKYLSILTDICSEDMALDEIQARRDQLLNELKTVYESAPSTTSTAYTAAQRALNVQEDMTFTEDEIDRFLPKELKRGS